jgi:hypothetical protein
MNWNKLRSFSYKTLLFLIVIAVPLSAQGKPTFKNGVVYLSRFISSDYFSSLKNRTADIDLVDTLYLRSYKYYRNDCSEALLALAFALLPYNEMNLKLPLIPATLTIPLPAVGEPLFDLKTRNLPSQFFYDSPGNSFGDKDKLPHFFGTAFIEYNFPIFNISKFLGIFVEKFEETFYVQGAMDKRDLYVNRLGARFGKGLREKSNLLPSEFLKKYSYNKK